MPETAQSLRGASVPVRVTPKERFSTRRAYAQTFTASVVTRGLGVLSGVLAARLLGPSGRGELAVIVFLPVLLAQVGEIELPRSLAYEVSRTDGVSPRTVATGFWVALALGCLQSLFLLAVLPVFLPADKLQLLPSAKWFVAYLPAICVASSLTGVDQGRGRFGRFSLMQILPGAVYAMAILVAWLAGMASPENLAIGLLAGALVTCAVRLAMDWRAVTHAMPNWDTARRLLKKGFTFYLPAMAGLFLLRSDMLLAVRLLPMAAIGLYTVARAISVAQIGMVTPFAQVGFAAVAGKTDQSQALETLARHFRLAQLTVVIMGLAGAVLTPVAIQVLFGSRFVGATVATFFLIGAMMCWGMAQVLDQGLRAAAHTRPGIFSNLIGLAVLTSLGFPGCIHYGIDGLACAMLCGEFVNLAALIAFCVIQLHMPKRLFWAFDVSTYNQVKAAARF